MKLISTLVFTVASCLALPTDDALHYGYHGPPAPLAHDGRVVDTPEVAHAKAAHLAAFAEAASKASYSSPHEENYVSGYDNSDVNYGPIKQTGVYGFSHPVLYSARIHHDGHGYHGPSAPLDHEGRVIDTPEVEHAKAAHFAAHKAASSYAYAPVASYEDYSYGGPIHGAYHGPAAPLAHDGRVVDTPEVAHAKAAHFAAYASAAHGKPYNTYGYY